MLSWEQSHCWRYFGQSEIWLNAVVKTKCSRYVTRVVNPNIAMMRCWPTEETLRYLATYNGTVTLINVVGDGMWHFSAWLSIVLYRIKCNKIVFIALPLHFQEIRFIISHTPNLVHFQHWLTIFEFDSLGIMLGMRHIDQRWTKPAVVFPISLFCVGGRAIKILL